MLSPQVTVDSWFWYVLLHVWDSHSSSIFLHYAGRVLGRAVTALSTLLLWKRMGYILPMFFCSGVQPSAWVPPLLGQFYWSDKQSIYLTSCFCGLGPCIQWVDNRRLIPLQLTCILLTPPWCVCEGAGLPVGLLWWRICQPSKTTRSIMNSRWSLAPYPYGIAHALTTC